MAQLRTAPPRWLWHRGLWPYAPGHFGLLHRNQRDSTYRLLCDLKFCFRTQTIMWLEVLQFRFHTWNISRHGIFLGLKFRLRTRNILRLKVRQFRFRIQNSVWLGALKWRNSASAQGKYCGLEVPKFHFHTINLVQLEVLQFRFHTRALTLSLAVPPPHKEYPVTWSSAVSLPHKEHRNILCLEVQLFCFHTQNNLWLEVPQFRTIYCDLNFRSSASARKDVIWNSALLLLHENITFLWKIHSHSTAHPFLNFCADLHDWWTLWRTEKRRNRDAPGKSRR